MLHLIHHSNLNSIEGWTIMPVAASSRERPYIATAQIEREEAAESFHLLADQIIWVAPEHYCWGQPAGESRVYFTALGENVQIDLPFDGMRMSPEIEWVDAHAEDLAALAGEWVAVDGSGIVVHGKDYMQTRAAAIAQGVRVPFIFRVPEVEDSIFMGL